MPSDDFLALNPGYKAAKANKYKAEPTYADGIRFASKAEARRYGELKLLEKAGTISSLTLQPRYELPGGIRYVGDFAYTENGQAVCEDVKGMETPVFRLKKRLFLDTYPDIELRIVS